MIISGMHSVRERGMNWVAKWLGGQFLNCNIWGACLTESAIPRYQQLPPTLLFLKNPGSTPASPQANHYNYNKQIVTLWTPFLLSSNSGIKEKQWFSMGKNTIVVFSQFVKFMLTYCYFYDNKPKHVKIIYYQLVYFLMLSVVLF